MTTQGMDPIRETYRSCGVGATGTIFELGMKRASSCLCRSVLGESPRTGYLWPYVGRTFCTGVSN
jgi:hypothetical protein